MLVHSVAKNATLEIFSRLAILYYHAWTQQQKSEPKQQQSARPAPPSSITYTQFRKLLEQCDAIVPWLKVMELMCVFSAVLCVRDHKVCFLSRFVRFLSSHFFKSSDGFDSTYNSATHALNVQQLQKLTGSITQQLTVTQLTRQLKSSLESGNTHTVPQQSTAAAVSSAVPPATKPELGQGSQAAAADTAATASDHPSAAAPDSKNIILLPAVRLRSDADAAVTTKPATRIQIDRSLLSSCLLPVHLQASFFCLCIVHVGSRLPFFCFLTQDFAQQLRRLALTQSEQPAASLNSTIAGTATVTGEQLHSLLSSILTDDQSTGQRVSEWPLFAVFVSTFAAMQPVNAAPLSPRQRVLRLTDLYAGVFCVIFRRLNICVTDCTVSGGCCSIFFFCSDSLWHFLLRQSIG